MSNFARKSSPSSPSVSPPPASKSDSTNKAGVKPFEKSKESEQNMPEKMQTPESEKQKPTSLAIAAAATPDSKENVVDPSSKSAKEVRPEVVKAKKRRLYEHAAPVYDNRQIFAADLLQTQLDYQGNLR